MSENKKKTKKKLSIAQDEEEGLKIEFREADCENPENIYGKECNKFLLREELLERKELEEHPDTEEFLYPTLNDPNFNLKIAEKKEFNDSKYDGELYDIKKRADVLSNADFELAPHQLFVRNFLSFQTPYNSLLLYHGLGTGKCLALNTPLIMYDGSIKMVQDIESGDLLMGDDSTPRTVLSLARGKDKMYDIIPENGEKYTVNHEHILCLRDMSSFSVIEKAIKDYLLLSDEKKATLKGYKVAVDFEEKVTPEDPYIVGNRLGSQENVCIPFLYKCNSREKRLRLLAGLLDDNGSFMNNQYELTYNDDIKDIVYLVRSLGLACSFSENNKLVIFGGGIEKIPTKIVVSEKARTTDHLLTNIKVEYVNDDDYYGFTLDGNCRFLLSDFTVTHNTCSAIGVCEEQREYLKQMGLNKRIIIVASPNVQDNFRLQLFDERKLVQTNGIWTMRGCVGNKLLKEINPMNMKGVTKEKVMAQIKQVIQNSYQFMGYVEFANYIEKTEQVQGTYKTERDRRRQMSLNLNNEFQNRLIVIDEVHNITSIEEKNKKIAQQLMVLVKSADNLRLLLLSATPMYNSYKEIIWLINLMNLNDRRGLVEVSDIFDKLGNFKKNAEGKEVGKELLMQKVTGYISFVRGDNPYTFPFRVYPSVFSPESTFSETRPYPLVQMNGKRITDSEKIVKVSNLFLTNIGSYQSMGYEFIMNSLRKRKISVTTSKGVSREMPSFENMDSFGYTLLQLPLESLIIVYPANDLEEAVSNIRTSKKSVELVEVEPIEPDANPVEFEPIVEPASKTAREERDVFLNANDLTGGKGLENVMNFIDSVSPAEKGSFEYKASTLRNFGRIFSPGEIGKYSSKIKSICSSIQSNSEGIILIYSQYIDGGLIPMALALEEMGFTRFGENTKSLFKTSPTEPIDAKTMKPRDKGVAGAAGAAFFPAKYTMITGDHRISPNNDFEVKAITGDDNKDGNKIKVVLISNAGSEGLDFKCIRQIHILNPWYNTNRIEQIIGRGVRNFSHKDLDFEKRNVQIFIHGTILEDENEEAADLYVYRFAHKKAIQIGKVSRVLKENAVDCIINHEQTNYTQENISETMKKPVKQILSNGKLIEDFKVGDAPYSATCDYMETCDYSCNPDVDFEKIDVSEESYDESFIMLNTEKLMQKIRGLMREHFFYLKDELIKRINVPKPYPKVQIYAALTRLVEDRSEFITDKYQRSGYLVNVGEYYLFQPSELNDTKISIFDRSTPIDFKHDVIRFELKDALPKEDEELGEEPKDFDDSRESAEIMSDLKEQYDLAISMAKSKKKPPRGDENWYKHCGLAMQKLIKEHAIPPEDVLEFLVEHIVDMMSYEDKVSVLNHISSIDIKDENSFEARIKAVLDKKIIRTKKHTGIVLYSLDKRKVLIQKNGLWVDAGTEDAREIAEEVAKMLSISGDAYNRYVGFIGHEQKNRYLVFKVKDTTIRRNTGARCDEANKGRRITLLNEIIGEEKYTKENKKGMVQAEMCALQEFLLRYYNKTRKNDKIWFLDFELALLYQF